MRYSVIHTELNFFGIYEYEFHLVRSRLVKNTYYKRVHTYRFTHARCASDKQVRHLCNVKKHFCSRKVNAESGSYLALGISEFVAVNKRAQVNNRNVLVRHFYADCALSGDNARNTHC